MHTSDPIGGRSIATYQAPSDNVVEPWEGEFAHAQLSVSSFEPHHSTTVSYPECSLLKQSETLCLYPMDWNVATKHRHEPLPLIRDEAVTHHAYREGEAEVSFFTRTRAQGCVPSYGTPPSVAKPFLSQFVRLVQDMEIAESFIGDTTLRMLTFHRQYQNGEKSGNMVRIARDTHFRRYGMAPLAVRRVEYVFSLDTLYSDDGPRDLAAPWYHSLRMVPQRGSDRAYNRVRLRMAMQGKEDEHVESYGFKPVRREIFGTLLDRKLTAVNPADLEGEDKTCFVCSGMLGEGDAKDPVALPCSEKHILCKGCLLKWVNSVGPASASCPQCREKIFTQRHEVDDLRFGLVNGIYEYDERFTAFENFERSCADLDQELAEDKKHEMIVHADLLIRIWDLLLNGSSLEGDNDDDPCSTPKHLQPLQFPEWNMADEVFRHQLFSRDGVGTTSGAPFRSLLEEVYCAFYRELCKSGLDQCLSHRQQMQVLIEGPVDSEYLDTRPGFKECFKRCLNRTLRFHKLRKYCCSTGFHSHGLRTYYNPTGMYSGADRHQNRIDADGDLDMNDCCE